MKLLPPLAFIFATTFFLSVNVFAQKQLGSQKVRSIVQQMTIDEKLTLMSGEGFSTAAIPRVGIPAVHMSDGPMGVAWPSPTVAFPSTITLTSTFNPSLMKQYGQAIGQQVKAHGKHAILGPCVNLARYPLSGRVFECTGEDPYLAGVFAKQYILGVQSEDVIATVKHFAANDQEYRRTKSDSRMSERALREVHLLPFEEAIKSAKAGAIMAGYNSLNGSFNTENRKLLIDILQKEWGFEGIRMSDWWASKNALNSALNGLDLEMPYGHLNKTELRPLFEKCMDDLTKCPVPLAVIDEKVERILMTYDRFGFLDPNAQRQPGVINYPASEMQKHLNFSLDVAREGMVLLQNKDEVLPLDVNTKNIKQIALFGSAAAFARASGGGSGRVNTDRVAISPMQGIQQRLNEMNRTDVAVKYAVGEVYAPSMDPAPVAYMFHKNESTGDLEPGLVGEYYTNEKLEGAPELTRVEKEINFDWWQAPHYRTDYFSVKMSGYLKIPQSGEHEFVFTHDDGLIVELDDQAIIHDWKYDEKLATRISRHKMNLEGNRLYKFTIKYYEHFAWARLAFSLRVPKVNGQLPILTHEAASLASQSDVAVVFVGFNQAIETEDVDRADMSLPPEQYKLVDAVSAVNPNTVVVVYAGGIVDLSPFKNKVKGIIYAWYPGEVVGLATADVLLGLASPSGKLPMTLPFRWTDSPAYTADPVKNDIINYDEGILIGYRWFDTKVISPLFPFGHGLTYTSFEFSKDAHMTIIDSGTQNPKMKVSMTIRNTGKREGKEAVQLYVSDLNPQREKSYQELKKIEKVSLKVGELKVVSFELSARDFAYWDVASHSWKIDPSTYSIRIGDSSRGIKVTKEVTLK